MLRSYKFVDVILSSKLWVIISVLLSGQKWCLFSKLQNRIVPWRYLGSA